VTTVDNLCSDLLNWDTLYLAGRMHKPLRIIKDDARVRLTQQVNLVSAARVALLTLPARFDSAALFTRVAGFSYEGDPRMALPAESRSKVANIVAAQKPQFVELLRALPGLQWDEAADEFTQDVSPAARGLHLRKLPSTLLQAVEARLAAKGNLPSKKTDENAYWAHIAGEDLLQSTIQTGRSFMFAPPTPFAHVLCFRDQQHCPLPGAHPIPQGPRQRGAGKGRTLQRRQDRQVVGELEKVSRVRHQRRHGS
jgi:translocator assembly and maintenance protein 41